MLLFALLVLEGVITAFVMTAVFDCLFVFHFVFDLFPDEVLVLGIEYLDFEISASCVGSLFVDLFWFLG